MPGMVVATNRTNTVRKNLMVKETIKEVKKVWGYEEIFVNNDKYGFKKLHIDEGAVSSIHNHKKKQETFIGDSGQVGLMIDYKDYMMNPFSRPKTVMPGVYHQFVGLSKNAVLLEVSTHDDPEDSYRLTQSQPAPKLTKPVKISFLSKAGAKIRKPSVKMTKPVKISFLTKGVKPRVVRLTSSQPKQ